MSRKTKTELDILTHAYTKTPTLENAARLIATLQAALETSEADRISLEKDIRKLEIFLSEKTDCGRKKP